jgi:hypothetical protein
MTFHRDSIQVFKEALHAGNLDQNNGGTRYVGDYMYMFSTGAGKNTTDHFKHIYSREYIKLKSQPKNY